jgi:hypothetical protein
MTTKKTEPDAASEKTAKFSTEDAIRIIATTLYAPNGGGPEHRTEAEAFFNSISKED